MKFEETNCYNCDARCCYDGVYLENGEEDKILQFIADNKQYFDNISVSYIVDGDWIGLEDRRKTNKIYCDDYKPDYPKHFTKTKCVFRNNDRTCQLEKVANIIGAKVSDIKPISCRKFPLQKVANEYKIPSGEDKYNLGDEYPGYISFMPCVKQSEQEIYKTARDF